MEFTCSMAVSEGFCKSIGKLGAACAWINGTCTIDSGSSSCGSNRVASKCAAASLSCVWDTQACLNKCPKGGSASWPDCLLPKCNSMSGEKSVAACTACSGPGAANCTVGVCADGYHPYERDLQQCRPIQEPSPPQDTTKEVVKKVRIKLAIDISTIAPGSPAREQFEQDFSNDVAARLGINASRIIINAISAGSVIVDFSIRPDPVSGQPIQTAVITQQFAEPGISIAGTTTATAITAASVATQVQAKPTANPDPPVNPNPTDVTRPKTPSSASSAAISGTIAIAALAMEFL